MMAKKPMRLSILSAREPATLTGADGAAGALRHAGWSLLMWRPADGRRREDTPRPVVPPVIGG